jgi:hypothetical protein
MRGDNPITDADVRSAMDDMEHRGALVTQLFKERDAAVARAERAEARLSEAGYPALRAEIEGAQAQVRALREALAPMLVVLDAWVADRSLLDSTPLHNIREAARAVLEEVK